MKKCLFVVVCTFGAGSSLMLRLNVESVLREMGAEGCAVEVSDMGSCKEKLGTATAFLCSIVLEENLKNSIAGVPVAGIKNFYSKEELRSVLTPFVT